MSKVKITGASNAAPQQLIGTSSNPEFGYVRVESFVDQVVGGWVNTVKRSALIKAKIETLQRLYGNKTIGSELEGQIIAKESLEPFFEGQEAKRTNNNADGVVLFKRVEGVEKPIYRITEYTTNMEEQDVLIQHDNVLSATARQVMGTNAEARIN